MSADILRSINRRLSHDYQADWHDRLMYVRHPLTVLALVTIVATIAAVCLDERAWPPAIVGAAAIILGVAWPRIGLLPASGALSFVARRAVEGEPTVVRLQLANRAPWRAAGLFIETEGPRLETDAPANSPTIALAPLRPFSDDSFTWELRPPRRGCFPRLTPCLVTGFPFGLERRRKPLGVVSQLLVLPRTYRIVGLPNPQRLVSFDGCSESKRIGCTGATLGVRPFRCGDGRRDVHWRQTARRGELIVREREATESARVRLIIDASRSACGLDHPDLVLDWLVRFAASVARHVSGAGTEVQLATPLKRGGSVQGSELDDALGLLELDERSPSSIFRGAAGRVARGIEPWYIGTAAGYSLLSAEDKAAAGWRFFLLDVVGGRRDSDFLLNRVVADRRVFVVSLPTASIREHSAEDGSFHACPQ
jgi:uncharacterized protein (DUF58 family)